MISSKKLNQFAVLFIALGGLMGSLYEVSFLAALFYIIGLSCFLFCAAKKELFLWVIIVIALFLLLNFASFENTKNAFVMSAEFGTMMIAISFVGLAVKTSHIKSLIQRIFARKKTNLFSYLLGHLSGVVLNLSGLIILSSSLNSEKNKHPSSSSLVSIHQGFSFAPAWSPYSYFTPIILGTFTTLSWFDLVFVAFIFILPMCFISSFTLPKEIEKITTHEDIPKKRSLKENRALVYTLIFCFSIISIMSFTSIQPKVLIHWILPLLALTWAFLESSSLKLFFINTKEHLLNNIPSLRFEILALSTAGLMSAVIITLPISTYLNPTDLINISNSSLWVTSFLVVCVFSCMVALMLLGINPILFVGVIATGVSLELFSTITGVAILVGAWGLFPTISPFAAANLVVARATNLLGKDLCFKINKKYNLVSFFVCMVLILIIHSLNLGQIFT